MALEPVLATTDTGESPELRDVTRRFWIGLVLTLPVLVLEMGSHIIDIGHLIGHHVSNWIQMVLATPVGHPLTRKKNVTFDDTLEYEHVSLHEGSTLHAFLTELVRDQRRKLQIRIQIRSEFVRDRSSPRDGSYLFQYHVRISNEGTETAQLISREWIVTNADGDVERIKGPGVIGEQPVLQPGGSFEYTSFWQLKTAVGAMQGSYQMVTEGGDRFDAFIAPFTLAIPNAIN